MHVTVMFKCSPEPYWLQLKQQECYMVILTDCLIAGHEIVIHFFVEIVGLEWAHHTTHSEARAITILHEIDFI